MPTMIGSNDIGGAFVRLGFTDSAGRFLRAGTRLSAAEVNAMKNHKALVRIGKIAVFPPSGDAPATAGERHIVHNGGGRFDVIAGRRLNDKPLTKDEAEELATRPN